ncbi:nuclear envelope pore membrane protein POM 121 [Xenopus laevis]|nr:nuclear envelope pore membrane protein POM 121 [Xenopus laevis]AAV84913.1 nuclear pore protein pom121 [Xenopus laevis]
MEGGCCWDLVKRIQPIALPLALSLVTCALAYIYNQLTVAGLLLASCWTYRSSGRRFIVWKWLTGPRLVASTKKLRNSTDWRLQSPPVSLLEGSPSPLSLNMGTYMNKQELPARGEACGPRAIKEKLSRPNPSVATPIRRLSFRDPLSSSNRTYLCARRDYPLKQEIYSKPGSLPRVSLDGQSQQRVPLTPRHFTRRTPVKISPQDLKTRFQLAPQPNVVSSPHLDFEQEPCLPSIYHRVEHETSVTHSRHLLEPEQYPASPSSHKANTFEATFSSHHVEDPCATESVLRALKECLKRKRIRDEDSEDTENKRRKENGEESKLLVNDSLCRTSKMEASRASWRSESSSMENLSQQSSISIQDMLNEVQNSKNSDGKVSPASSFNLENLSKRKIITVPGHNEITSSLSSSRYLQKKKRSLEIPRCDTPEWPIKKMRKDRLETSMSPSQETMKTQMSETQKVEVNPSPVQLHKPKGNLPWKRNVHLICPEHPEEFYRLPPGPIPGYNVTQADYDAAKEAAQQRFLRLFQEPSAPSVPSASESCSKQVSLTLQTSTSPDKSFQAVNEKPNISAANTTFTLFSSSSDAKSVTSSSSTPSPFTSATTSITNTLLQSLGSGQTKSESPFPKNSLLQILGKTEGNNSQPMFNPVFGPLGSANPSPVTAAPGLSTTTTAILKPICGDPPSQQAQTSMFKPIFEPPSSQTVPSALSSPFVFSSSSSTTSTTSFLGTTGNSVNTGKHEKPNLALTTCASNTTITSSLAPTFGITSKVEPVSLGGPASQANTSFSVIGSTSVPAISTAFGSTTSAFTAAGQTANPSFSANTAPIGVSSVSASEGQTSISTTATFSKFGVPVGQNVFSASNPFGSGTQSTMGTSTQSATNIAFSFGTSTSTQSAFGFSQNPTMLFSSSTKSNNPTNTSGFNSMGSVFGSSTVPTSSIVTPNKSLSTLGIPEKCETKNQLVTNQLSLGQGSTPAPFPSIMPTQSFVSSSTSFAPSTPTVNQSSTPGSFPSMAAVQPFTSPSSPAAGFFSHGTAPKSRTAVRHKLHPRRPHPRKK